MTEKSSFKGTHREKRIFAESVCVNLFCEDIHEPAFCPFAALRLLSGAQFALNLGGTVEHCFIPFGSGRSDAFYFF